MQRWQSVVLAVGLVWLGWALLLGRESTLMGRQEHPAQCPALDLVPGALLSALRATQGPCVCAHSPLLNGLGSKPDIKSFLKSSLCGKDPMTLAIRAYTNVVLTVCQTSRFTPHNSKIKSSCLMPMEVK